MRLKNLQLVGFKTFADRTEVAFHDGLTAVVGPNGCGKSNIVDAIQWVLGEQNPRNLRAGEARDVIFAGTEKRKPLGMAEVRLTVNNEDRTLPIDFSEVTISRRIYRSGESQYALNGAACRLKDVVDLFLDTGLGRGAYAFVTQNEVDAVLSARAEDRRILFEEAAGISKYRARKREAVRKLEQAEANLTRVRDILAELRLQREPLEEQARVARRHRELTQRLQGIEVDLLVAEMKRVDYELYAARREQELDRESIARFDADLARLERESEAAGTRLAEAEAELDTARLSQQGALTSVERLESRAELAAERRAAAERTMDALDVELKDLAERIRALEAERAVRQKELDKVAGGASEEAESVRARRREVAELAAALAEARRRVENSQETARRIVEASAMRESKLATTRARLEDLRQRQAGLASEIAELAARRHEINRRVAAAEENRNARMAEQEALAQRIATLSAEREASDRQASEARKLAEGCARRLAEAESRLATLEEMRQSGEGYYQGVRAVLGAARQGRLSGAYTPLVDLIEVVEDHRTAIEVALGSAAQDVVCETDDDAKRAIDWLKSNRAGRATFLPLASLRPPAPVSLSGVSAKDGVVGRASDLVKAAAHYAPAVQLVLGRTVVTRDLDAALAVSRTLQGWSRIVTLAGELIAPGGAITGGSLQGRGTHLLGRKGEIDDLRRAIPGIRSELAQHQAAADVARAASAELQEQSREARTNAEAVRVALARVETEIEAARRDEERLSRALASTQSDLQRVQDAARQTEQEIEELTRARADDETEDATVEAAIQSAHQEVQRLTAAHDAARADLMKLEVDAGRASERRAALDRVVASLAQQLAQATAARREKQAQREQAGAQWREADAMAADVATRLAEAQAQLARCEEHFAHWRDRRQQLLQANFDLSNTIKELAQARARVTDDLHAAELQIARLEVRRLQTAQRLQDEYDLSAEEALARPDPGDIERETVNEVARIRRELRQMGEVNTGAIEEYERLTERHAFLTDQENDLARARESLFSTIAEIDESTRAVFETTFSAVKKEFAAIFGRLFGGGTTELALTDPNNVLDTGIEVVVQPPGKRPQSLSLLSGGERALTAVALLFAFIAVRPSPFVVLDEIDAPMDGPNVEKFVELVKDFSATTQFLIITHNPTTMEAAPSWYGVTMQEPGVSRVLCYRAPIAVAAGEAAEDQNE